ncbi:MAG: hypothetical protein WHS44_12285 [Fimbriimonadales bacterium]|nr:MAG: hypothetical protein KatS3mg018_2128 [Fimbriimonadales bacterium]
MTGWWRRYFSDNAAVWLLRRWNRIELQRALDSRTQLLGRELDRAVRQGDRERVQAILAEMASRARVPPTEPRFWQAGDGRRALILYGLATLALLTYALTPGGILSLLHGRRLLLLVVWLGLSFAPLVYNALLAMLQREHAQGTSAFLRLTRLGGDDLLHGAYTTYAIAGAMRIFLLWGAPLLIAGATLVYGSLLTAMVYCVRVGLCYLGWALLWQTLTALLVSPRATLIWQVASGLMQLLVGVGGTLGGVYVTLLWQSSGALQAMAQSPWAWATRGEFWLSLVFPPLGAAACAWVLHPLWGALHGAVALGMVRLLAPLAAQRLQRALDAPEPEPVSQEGAWW